MTLGHVRDNFPCVTLSIASRGSDHRVEFIVDTGFDGELALPSSILDNLNLESGDYRYVRLADRTLVRSESYDIAIYWNDERRIVDVLRLEGNPLLGVELLAGHLIQIEMNDGGEVSIEEL